MKLIIAGSPHVHRLSAPVPGAGAGAPPHHGGAHGGARGADQLGYRWAWKHQSAQLFRADWERFGKSAGVRRNHQMAQAGDMLLAFWDGQSHRHGPHGAVHAASSANPSWSSAWRPRHKKSAWHVSRRFSRASEPREGSVALDQPPYLTRE